MKTNVLIVPALLAAGITGAVLSVPDGHDPSPVLRALMELEMVAVPRTETAELRAIPLSMA